MPSVASGVTTRGHRFLVMERVDDKEGGMASVSPFAIQRALQDFGELKISLLRNQTVLLETQNAEQTSRLLALTTVGRVPVKVTQHPKLNRSRGVIKCWGLCQCDREELLEELKEFNVVAVREIKRHMTDAEEAKCILEKKEKTRKHTGIFLLTFNTPDLPETLDMGFLGKVEVKLYIPKPLRCFRCQRLGHAMVTCKEAEGPKGPQKKGKKPPKCLNCKGSHESWDKSCPVYEKEAAILKMKVEKQVTYKIAQTLNLTFKTATEATQTVPCECQGASHPQEAPQAPKAKTKKAKKP